MLKVDSMGLVLKMDRSIDTDKHYISPGGYELLFGNGESVAFDFYESYGNIDKNDESTIHFELCDLDTDSFPEAEKLAGLLIGSRVKEITECYIYTGEEDGKEEINPVEIKEMYFLISDNDNEMTVEVVDKILSAYSFQEDCTDNRLADIPNGNDAIFLPGKIHGCEWQVYIIYLNESANGGKGSFEIEIVDAQRILQLYAAVLGNEEAFFDALPDWFQGEWYYCNNGEDSFDEYVDMFPKADFIVGCDGGPHEEMMFLVNWAIKAIEKMR